MNHIVLDSDPDETAGLYFLWIINYFGSGNVFRIPGTVKVSEKNGVMKFFRLNVSFHADKSILPPYAT